jgi:acyl-coenzyme A thioesterase PaaI-like protein
MTGTLTIRYLRPTPLHTELIIEAELVRIKGRKIFTEGRILADGLLTAEAEGLFISIDPSKMEALVKAREGYESRREN